MKTKRILLLGREIEYALTKRARAKNLRITVHQDGRVAATLPEGIPERAMDAFFMKRAEWVLREVDRVGELGAASPGAGRRGREDYLKHREAARVLITERVEHFNRLYGFEYNQIRIKDTKSCWGSCSAKKNLNFSYRLLFLPPELSDYVVVHELCHLKELNHSDRFWDLVAEAVPDHKRLRRELRVFELH